MSDMWWLYLLTRLDDVKSLAVVALVCLLAYMLCVAFGAYLGDGFGEPKSIPWRKAGLAAAIICTTLVAVPSDRQLAIIIGGSMAKDAAVSETGRKVLRLLEGKLDQELKGLEK